MGTISAVFENGVFKPEEPVQLSPGTRVEVIVPTSDPDPVAIMRERYPNSFGTMAAEDADELQQIIDQEFGKVNPDDWR